MIEDIKESQTDEMSYVGDDEDYVNSMIDLKHKRSTKNEKEYRNGNVHDFRQEVAKVSTAVATVNASSTVATVNGLLSSSLSPHSLSPTSTSSSSTVPYSNSMSHMLKSNISSSSGSVNMLNESDLCSDLNASGCTSNVLLDIHKGKPIRLQVKVLVPVNDHPNFNFIGKLLGPKGNSLKWLQEQTLTKMAILGKGSMRDKEKEEELRRTGDSKFAHLNEELHVDITAFAPAPEAYLRIGHALNEVKRFLVPDYYDDIRQQQLRELGVLNVEQRTSNISNTGRIKSMNSESFRLIESCVDMDEPVSVTHSHSLPPSHHLPPVPHPPPPSIPPPPPLHPSSHSSIHHRHVTKKPRHHLRCDDLVYDCEQIQMKTASKPYYERNELSQANKSRGNYIIKDYHLPYNFDEEIEVKPNYQWTRKISNRNNRTFYKSVAPYPKYVHLTN